ncbi:MAG: hypothetical protein K8R48_00300 [Alphaproteobacteria bacterium]|nr:hypothetical protein [Alphaproteobacteria bacterium]
MKKIFILFFVFSLWSMLAGSAAAAVIINDQGAAELKKSVENELLWRADLAKITGNGLNIGGAVTVTPKPAFYEVKIPDLSVTFGAQEKLNIGTVTINAVPGKDGEWMTSVALPAVMTITNGAQAPLASITIGSQHFAGAWIPAKGIYPRFDALYQDILIKLSDADNTEIAIGTLKAVMNLKDSHDSTWSGQGNMEAGDVKLSTSGKSPVQLTVKKINATNVYDGLDIIKGQQIKKKIQDLAAAGQMPAEQKDLAFINGLISATQGMVDNFNNSLTAENISLSISGDPAKNLPPSEYTLDKMAFDGSLQGGRQEKATVSFKGGFNGVKLPPVADELTGMVPQALSIGLNIDNLPIQKITGMLFDNLKKSIEMLNTAKTSSPAANGAAQEQLRAIFSTSMQILQTAGTSLSIQDTFLKSQDLETGITGRVEANPAAALGMTGKITLSLKGLEESLLKLKTAAAKPGADPELNGYINGLTLMMMMGQSEKPAGGPAVYSYPFEIKSDTKTLFDGIKMLPGGGAPQATPLPPTAAPAP